MGWLKALWGGLPLPWKIGAVAAVLLGIFLLYRWQLNAAYEEGIETGKTLEQQSIAKAVEAKVSEEKAAMAIEWQSLNERSSQLEADRKRLTAERLMLQNERTQARATLDAANEAHKRLAAAVPDNELFDVVRAVSNELTINKR